MLEFGRDGVWNWTPRADQVVIAHQGRMRSLMSRPRCGRGCRNRWIFHRSTARLFPAIGWFLRWITDFLRRRPRWRGAWPVLAECGVRAEDVLILQPAAGSRSRRRPTHAVCCPMQCGRRCAGNDTIPHWKGAAGISPPVRQESAFTLLANCSMPTLCSRSRWPGLIPCRARVRRCRSLSRAVHTPRPSPRRMGKDTGNFSPKMTARSAS